MNSQATSPGASSTMRSAHAPACSSSGKPATTTARRSGIGSRRTSADVTIASVPSLPVTSARRSLASVSSSHAIVPSPKTTSIPSTWSAVTPWPRQCSPPAFVPMLPPITEAAREDGSGVKRRPCSRASRSSTALGRPGCTSAVRSSTSRSRMPFMRLNAITRPPRVGTVAPVSEVPPPRATIGTPCSRAMRTAVATCSLVSG